MTSFESAKVESIEQRLGRMEGTLDDMVEVIKRFEVFFFRVEQLDKNYCKMDLRIDELEKAPAKKYDSFKTHFITALISAGVSGLVVHYIDILFK